MKKLFRESQVTLKKKLLNPLIQLPTATLEIHISGLTLWPPTPTHPSWSSQLIKSKKLGETKSRRSWTGHQWTWIPLIHIPTSFWKRTERCYKVNTCSAFFWENTISIISWNYHMLTLWFLNLEGEQNKLWMWPYLWRLIQKQWEVLFHKYIHPTDNW